MQKYATISLSPSQMNTARLCLRKWGFSYIDKIRFPSTPAQKAGTDLHKAVEDWLVDKKIPDIATDAGKLLLSGVNLLPVPDPKLLVEHAFNFWDGDLYWRGFVDLINPLRSPHRITDHKTTKSFRWMKTEDELKKDPQAIIYAKYWLDTWNLNVVEAQWIYYKKGPAPVSADVVLNLTKEHVEKEYLKLRDIGYKLLELKNKYNSGLEIPVEEFPHSGCRAFGGCEYQETCHDLVTGRVSMSSLLARLKSLGDNGTDKTTKAAMAINPPEVVIEKEKGSTVEKPPLAEEHVEAAPEASAPVELPPARKRGRPKGSKNKGVAKAKTKTKEPDFVIEDIQVEVIEESPEPVTDALRLEESPQRQGFTLYVDCLPSGGAKPVSTVLVKAAVQAANENGVEHYRYMEYGKGPAALCLALDKILDDKPLSGNYSINTGNQMASDAVQVLESLAVEVVRSTR